MKDQIFTPSCFKDIGISKFEFVVHSPLNTAISSVRILQITAERTESLVESGLRLSSFVNKFYIFRSGITMLAPIFGPRTLNCGSLAALLPRPPTPPATRLPPGMETLR